jgi:hypothetical protein
MGTSGPNEQLTILRHTNRMRDKPKDDEARADCLCAGFLLENGNA